MRILARGSPGACHSGNRCRLVQRVDALLDQNPEQRGRDALAHRPSFERRLRSEAFAIALSDEPAFPSDHKRSSQPFSRLERCLDGCLELRGVDLRWRGIPRQHVAHGPGLGRRIGQSALYGDRSEIQSALTDRQRDTSLAPEVLGGADRTIR